MFNVGGGEIVVILILALIVLGPDKLPSAARQAGKYLSEFRRLSDGFQRELRDAMDLDGTKPQSATMAPVKDVQTAPPLTPEPVNATATTATTTAPDEQLDERSAERDDEGRPVGEAHRVVETGNGPTLPPVMEPTAIPETRTTVDSTTGNAVEVDGPSSSFG